MLRVQKMTGDCDSKPVLTDEQIAMICNEAVRGYGDACRDKETPLWKMIEPWTRKRCEERVERLQCEAGANPSNLVDQMYAAIIGVLKPND